MSRSTSCCVNLKILSFRVYYGTSWTFAWWFIRISTSIVYNRTTSAFSKNVFVGYILRF